MNSNGSNDMIIGKRIYLREIEEKDASLEYCNWLNDPLVNKFLETRNTTIEELKQYIKKRRNSENCLFYGIFLKDKNKHIGTIKLEPINFENKNAVLGILIGDKNWQGRGICTETVKLLVDYSFKVLNLTRIELSVISKNNAAIKCYRNAGLKIDRIEKKTAKRNNILYDMVFMSIEKN